jgi:hypothetical protein
VRATGRSPTHCAPPETPGKHDAVPADPCAGAVLGAASPAVEADYLYSASGTFRGEGLDLLRALAIETEGRAVETALGEFQRRGYLLGYVLECPVPGELLPQLLAARMEAAAARIRRSLKPKSLVVLGRELKKF